MKNKYLYLVVLLFILLHPFAYAQRQIRGRVLDSETAEPLAFAGIVIDSLRGTQADNRGYFTLILPKGISRIKASYVGYRSKYIPVSKQTFYEIKLTPEAMELGTVVISAKKKNPAIPLMKEVIRRKNKNDYRKKLPEYEMEKYYKFLVSVYRDSLNGRLDSIYRKGELIRVDSVNYRMKKMLESKDLFLMENVEKITSLNHQEKRRILAHRIAGLKEPLYELLAYQMNSYGLYDDQYRFLVKEYESPVSKSSIGRYAYRIEDTLYYQGRKIINIAYRHRHKPLITGNMYIDEKSKAIAYMSLNTNGSMVLNTKFHLKYFPLKDIWMPDHIVSLIRSGNGRDIEIDGVMRMSDKVETDSLEHSNSQSVLKYTYASILHRYSSLHFQVDGKNKGYDVQVDPESTQRDDAYWRKYRDSTEMLRAKATYQYIDSMSQKDHIEPKLRKMTRLAHGYVPVGKWDWYYSDLLDYNRYEGLRINADMMTNRDFSRKVRLAGHLAYGWKDRKFKYGASFRYQLSHEYQTYISVLYDKDLATGGSRIFYPRVENMFSALLEGTGRHWFIGREAYGLQADVLFGSHWSTRWHVLNTSYRSLEGIPLTPVFQRYLTECGVEMDYQPFSRFILTESGRQLLRKNYPVFGLSARYFFDRQGWEFDFYSLSLSTEWQVKWRTDIRTSVSAGYLFTSRNTPLWKLATLNANTYDDAWYRRILPVSQGAWETVSEAQFINHSVVSAGVRHSFYDLHIGENFRPDFSLTARFAMGLFSREYEGFENMHQGVWETGMEWGHLLNISFLRFGLGAYYRLGRYNSPVISDNFSLRWILSIDFNDQ